MLLGLLGTAACGPGAGERGDAATDGAGTPDGSAADRLLDWRFETDFVLGGDDEGPGSFTRVGPASVAVDRDGRIYVADRDAVAVQVFDAEGAWVRSFGRAGEGPGEFTRPHSVAVQPDGTVSVYDLGKRSLVRFGPAGEPLPEVRGELQPAPGVARHLAGAAGGVVVGLVEGSPRTHAVLLAQEGTRSDFVRIPVPDFQLHEFESCPGLRLRFPPVFAHLMPWDHRDGTVAVAPGPGYSVDLYRGSRRTSTVRRDLPVREGTAAAAREAVGEFALQMGPDMACTIPAAEQVERRGFEERIPWLDGVTLGPGGEIWVRRFALAPEEPAAVDVLDVDDGYVGTLPSGTPLPLGFTPDGRALLVDEDTLGVQRLVVARVVRGR